MLSREVGVAGLALTERLRTAVAALEDAGPVSGVFFAFNIVPADARPKRERASFRVTEDALYLYANLSQADWEACASPAAKVERLRGLLIDGMTRYARKIMGDDHVRAFTDRVAAQHLN